MRYLDKYIKTVLESQILDKTCDIIDISQKRKEGKRMKIKIKRLVSMLLTISLLAMSLSGCGISNQHLEMTYEENDNDNISTWDSVADSSVTTWDDGNVVYWSDVDDFSDAVYSQIVFDDISEDFPIVECRVLDFQSNGDYFDGEKVYQLVNDQFDVNSFVAKYAIGTGVIIICVVLTVATYGGTTPICCMIAGAAEGSATMALKMSAFSAAINAVDTAIKGGNLEDIMYGAIEGSADGYMYGAIFGAITGGMGSKYCFTEDTLVTTEEGLIPICDIKVGDKVYSYNEENETFQYEEVSQVMNSLTTETVSVLIGDEWIHSTPKHPYLTNNGWLEAQDLIEGDLVYTINGSYEPVLNVRNDDNEGGVPVYNLCINNSHTYAVGESSVIVHNRCKPNEKYANDTYLFPEGSEQALKYPNGVPFDANGFPIFDDYAVKTVKFDYPSLEGRANGTCLVGNCSSDFAMANKAAGFDKTPAGYTWHHNQDMMTMQLVPQDLHSVAFGGVAHAGGESQLQMFWELCKVFL